MLIIKLTQHLLCATQPGGAGTHSPVCLESWQQQPNGEVLLFFPFPRQANQGTENSLMCPRHFLSANVWSQAVWFSGSTTVLPVVQNGKFWAAHPAALKEHCHARRAPHGHTILCMTLILTLSFLTLRKQKGFHDVIPSHQLNLFKHSLILFQHWYFSIYRYFIRCYDSLTHKYCAMPSDKFCGEFDYVDFKDLDTHWQIASPKGCWGGGDDSLSCCCDKWICASKTELGVPIDRCPWSYWN